MANIQTFSATEFKAKCREILDRVGTQEVDRLVVTKRGKPVAVLTPSRSEDAAVRDTHGFMRGSVLVVPDFDLTEPVSMEVFADFGELHG
jgi:prevent-host-death family protein